MPEKTSLFIAAVATAILVAFSVSRISARQSLDSGDKQTDIQILKDAKDALQKNYYDPKFHGVNLDALFSQYQPKIQSSQSNHQAFSYVAAFVDSLNDSHTIFLPPDRVGQVDYGYTLQMIGDKCYVTHLRPGSDAEAKLHVGDQVTTREGFVVNRTDFPQMLYYFNLLSPVAQSNFDLVDPSGAARHQVVNAKTWMRAKVMDLTGGVGAANMLQLEREEEQVYDSDADRYVEIGDVLIWKMPQFSDQFDATSAMFGMARKHKTLILDLRGNPGGSIETLQNVVGFLFDHDVTIANRVRRKDSKDFAAKSRGSSAFPGKVIVLVDSSSASAAELLARVIQLENRGTVIGDQTSGMVMEAQFHPYQQGFGNVIAYAFEVTDADLIMKDGKSLEHVGVKPDEVILPTAQDLAAGNDPALAHAAQLAGLEMTPEQAGKLLPYEWLPIQQ